MTNGSEPPETLYHYTTAVGARGILTTGTVWATMIHYMNDAKEFGYALDLARDMINNHPLALNDAERRVICANFLDVIKNIAVYVFSLTEHHDQLSQWQAYSSDGGYALGIYTKHLHAIAETNRGALVKCVYDLSQQRELLAPIIDPMLTAAKALLLGSPDVDMYERYAALFTLVAATIKHPSFAEEEEWRIVVGPGVDAATVQYRVGGGLIIPYCEWLLREGDTYPLASVVVGPGPNVTRDLAGRSLRHLTSTRFGWPVEVIYSNAPLRPLR